MFPKRGGQKSATSGCFGYKFKCGLVFLRSARGKCGRRCVHRAAIDPEHEMTTDLVGLPLDCLSRTGHSRWNRTRCAKLDEKEIAALPANCVATRQKVIRQLR